MRHASAHSLYRLCLYITGNKTFANLNLSETSVAETYTVTCFTLDQNWETLVYQFPQLSFS